jgi:DNA-binding LacI/PurR family transcriptional regulator
MSLNPHLVDEATACELLHNRPRGVIVGEAAYLSAQTVSLIKRLRDGGLPIVVHGDGPELQNFDRVASDHMSGADKLTRWLISRGRRRILLYCISDKQVSAWARMRAQGYRHAMEEAGLEPIEAVIPPPPRSDGSRRAFMETARFVGGHLLEYLAAEPVDAMLCPSDGGVYRVAAACRLAGMAPGTDVLVVGYDNYWRDCPERRYEETIPAATVDKLNDIVGREMVRLLLNRIDGGLPAEPQRRIIEPKMIVCD